MWESNPGWAYQLCDLCRWRRDQTHARRCNNWPPDRERPQGSGEACEYSAQERPSTACLETVRPAFMAYRQVLFGESSAGCRRNVCIHYCATNLSFALVRWPHSRGLPTASEALASSSGVDWVSVEGETMPVKRVAPQVGSCRELLCLRGEHPYRGRDRGQRLPAGP